MSAEIGGLGGGEVAALNQRAPKEEAERPGGHVGFRLVRWDELHTLATTDFSPCRKEEEGVGARGLEPAHMVGQQGQRD